MTKKAHGFDAVGFDFFVIMFMSCKGCLTTTTLNNRMTGDYSPVAVSLLLTL